MEIPKGEGKNHTPKFEQPKIPVEYCNIFGRYPLEESFEVVKCKSCNNVLLKKVFCDHISHCLKYKGSKDYLTVGLSTPVINKPSFRVQPLPLSRLQTPQSPIQSPGTQISPFSSKILFLGESSDIEDDKEKDKDFQIDLNLLYSQDSNEDEDEAFLVRKKKKKTKKKTKKTKQKKSNEKKKKKKKSNTKNEDDLREKQELLAENKKKENENKQEKKKKKKKRAKKLKTLTKKRKRNSEKDKVDTQREKKRIKIEGKPKKLIPIPVRSSIFPSVPLVRVPITSLRTTKRIATAKDSLFAYQSLPTTVNQKKK